MVNTRIMCRKHLLGEHSECHMFEGTLRADKRLDNYFKNNLFEPLALIKRHNAIVNELSKKGFHHNTFIANHDLKLNHLTDEEINFKIDRKSSLRDLVNYRAHSTRLGCGQSPLSMPV
ncbi:MAG: pyrimidine dimer DNA glycosylase/endonuclease V [bacterium]